MEKVKRNSWLLFNFFTHISGISYRVFLIVQLIDITKLKQQNM